MDDKNIQHKPCTKLDEAKGDRKYEIPIKIDIIIKNLSHACKLNIGLSATFKYI